MNSTLRKAAVLLSSLDPQTTDSLLRQMDPSQANDLRTALGSLGTIDPAEQERVAAEFLDAHPNANSAALRDGGNADDPFGVGINNDGTDRKSTGNVAQSFGCLDEPEIARLSSLLEGEHPQTIALVVSHLTADRAAQIVAGLPGEVQAEVLRKLADLDEAHPDVIREIERILESRILAQSQGVERRTAGLTAVSNILAAADAPTNQVIRRNLARHDAELARSLAQTPFLFSDLAVLDDASLWTLLSAAEPDWVVLALIGAQPDLAERVATLLPPDEEADFRQALETIGPTRLSDVEEAQYRIAELGHRLELEGEIHRTNWRLGTVEV